MATIFLVTDVNPKARFLAAFEALLVIDSDIAADGPIYKWV
jgi:hypothetical protein